MRKSAATILLTTLVPMLNAQRPTEPPASQPADRKAGPKRQGGYLGLYLTEQPLARRRGIVTIDSVFPGSDAEKLGFQPGDVVLRVNGKRVRNGDAFIQMIWGTAPILRNRRGKSQPHRDEIVVRRGKEEIAIQAGMKELDANPKVGAAAPDFTLKAPDGKSERNLARMLGKKPLVLIFGSYT